MRHFCRRARPGAAAALLALAFGSACSGGGPPPPPAVNLGCVDDSKHCIDQRAGALRVLMADQGRTWVRQPATPTAYASGVRLFAFKTRRRELSCEELAIGRREADSAGGVLRGPGGAGLSPAQISRGAMLGTEVSRELGSEMRRRCRV